VTLQRREFLWLAGLAAAMPAASGFAQTQDYPSRPVRIIEGFGRGSTPDLVCGSSGNGLRSAWVSLS